ncbi:hypothetical protein OG874_16890 [Nocardia sp. NBC_00565]|uniref:hypothetical protein n=1 Tax=Nocardia sp. NBC_00565 TaxID=2975993 RepID=UPI002E805AA1|nr:hypothetical protein [Nocardia sp. NBC_00565]WUC06689.1 hypothetical protein OG874_16890 [Nocardia sp. NBC_00565]
MITKQSAVLSPRGIITVAVDLLPPAIVAAVTFAITSMLGYPLWMEVVCGLVIVAAAGHVMRNAVRRRRPTDATASASRRTLFAVAPPILALAALVSLQLLMQRPADRELESARGTVAQTATEAAVAILSYQPETVDQDLVAAQARLTGDFLDTYAKLANTVVGPTAKEKRVTMQATPAGAAVESASRDQATVIVYINQTTTVAGNPAPSQSQNALRVGLMKVDGSWLVNRFDPLF